MPRPESSHGPDDQAERRRGSKGSDSRVEDQMLLVASISQSSCHYWDSASIHSHKFFEELFVVVVYRPVSKPEDEVVDAAARLGGCFGDSPPLRPPLEWAGHDATWLWKR